MFAGDPGRIKASLTVRPFPTTNWLGYAHMNVVLDQVQQSNHHDILVGVGIHEPAVKGFVQTTVTSPEELGKVLEARLVLRLGAVQVGFEGAVERQASNLGVYAFTKANMRAVYSNTSASMYGRPHCYQLGLSVENFGRKIRGTFGIFCF